MPIRCPACSQPVEADQPFCPSCGQILQPRSDGAADPPAAEDLGGFLVKSRVTRQSVGDSEAGRRSRGPGGEPPQQPAANPSGGDLGPDEVKLRRDDASDSAVNGVIGEAWEAFKTRPAELVAISFVIGLVGSVGNIYQEVIKRMGDVDPWFFLVTFACLQIVCSLLQTFLTAGAIVYWLKLLREEEPSFGDLLCGFRFAAPIFTATLLSGLAVLGGSLLLVVPGIILGLGFSFVVHVAVDKNLGGVKALRASWRLTDGYKLDLFLLGLFLGLVNLLGMMACCVGLFVTIPLSTGAAVIAYNRIAEPGGAYLDSR